MFNITLIASVHKERGICNSNELHKIIERIAPDVIFEEISPGGFTAIYKGFREDYLETKTIKRYLQNNPIAHVPVDLDGNELIDKHLKNDIQEMFDIFYNDFEYQKLSNQRGVLSEQYGFPFLNSDHHREIMERIRLFEEDFLSKFNHKKLFLTYKSWLDINDKREDEMIKNIYTYSALNKYNRALFLVGAEHRKPIMDKVLNLEKNNYPELNWIFNYFN
jgi:hypothetical protein